MAKPLFENPEETQDFSLMDRITLKERVLITHPDQIRENAVEPSSIIPENFISNRFSTGKGGNRVEIDSPNQDLDAFFSRINFYVAGTAHPVCRVVLAETVGGGYSLKIINQTTLGTSTSVNLHEDAVDIQGSGNVFIEIDSSDNLVFGNLPTSTPGGSGRIWNDSGTLKIT